MGVRKIFIESLIASDRNVRLLDVRTPAEYEKGHIPGALNLPLFSNEERAIVGTCYKQEGPDQALLKGLELVGPKMADYILQARALAPDQEVVLYCWRGGKRSSSLGWLLSQANFDVTVLEGGYKAYRNYILKKFEALPLKLLILGGKTGSGKTEVLKALREVGEQVIDLERLANHKGSAFGMIGENQQPSVEQFENHLFQLAETLDHDKPIWIENESRGIGKVYIPQGFWNQMKKAPLVKIEVPYEERLALLVNYYGGTSMQELKSAFCRIKKRLGGQNLKLAFSALEDQDLKTAASIALRYYDKAYEYNFHNNIAPEIHDLTFRHMDISKITSTLIDYSQKNIYFENNDSTRNKTNSI